MKLKHKQLYDLNLKDFGHLKDEQIMGLTIYAESRGEPETGKIGVGSTILNRVDYRDWDGKTIMEVCLWPYQFSCYLPNDPNRKLLLDIVNGFVAKPFDARYASNNVFKVCVDIAIGMIEGGIKRNTKAMQYLNPSLAEETKKKWLDSGMKVVMKIGSHEWFI